MDYKTESLPVTQERVKQPGEDTQLAFYAALLGEEPHRELRAAYINVGERGETRTVEQTDVIQARDLLLAGIEQDMARIAQGAPLPALGEGRACEYCAARGLCRKDFWA
jgi:ATP-dependent helicase/nuclease subunit B